MYSTRCSLKEHTQLKRIIYCTVLNIDTDISAQSVLVVVVVALLFNVHGKHVRSYRDGQLT